MLSFELATDADEADLRSLLRTMPFEGRISLSYEREPNYFDACTIEGFKVQTLIAREDGRAVGLFSRQLRKMWINGTMQDVAYLGHLRIAPSHRNKIGYVRRGFECLHSLPGCSPDIPHFTTIISDNHKALRLLTTGIKRLPHYQPLGNLHTLTLPVSERRVGSPCPRVTQQAEPKDLPEIIQLLQQQHKQYQLATWLDDKNIDQLATRNLRAKDFFIIRQQGRLCACLALWDQRSFKQHVVRGYARPLQQWRFLINLAASMNIGIHLPKPGQTLDCAYLAHLAIEDDDPAMMIALIKAAMHEARQRGIKLLLIGLGEQHPLLEPCRRAFRHLDYSSQVFQVSWPGSPPIQLNNNLIHLEIATL